MDAKPSADRSAEMAASEIVIGSPPEGMSPREAVLDVCGGGGVGAPIVGISPANTDIDTKTIKARAAEKRFIVFLLKVGMQDFLHKTE